MTRDIRKCLKLHGVLGEGEHVQISFEIKTDVTNPVCSLKRKLLTICKKIVEYSETNEYIQEYKEQIGQEEDELIRDLTTCILFTIFVLSLCCTEMRSTAVIKVTVTALC